MSKCATGKCAAPKVKPARCKRTAVRDKRAAIRKEMRNAAKGVCSCLLASAITLALLAGCNTATPSSKSAASKACDNVTTVNNYIGILPGGLTNGVALGAGGITISVSDLNGTIAQSADTEGGDRTDMTANPSMAAGITGDAPMAAMMDAVSSFATPASAADAAIDALLKKFGLGATTNAVADAVDSACASGTCPGNATAK